MDWDLAVFSFPRFTSKLLGSTSRKCSPSLSIAGGMGESSWNIRARQDPGSERRVVRVVARDLPPTFRRIMSLAGIPGIALKCCFYLQTDFLVVGSLFPEEMASDEVGVSDPSAAHFFAVCRGEVAL